MLHKFIGYHISERLDIALLKNKLQYNLIKHDPTELLYEKDENKLIYIFNYGSIIFMNFDEIEISSVIDFLRQSLSLQEVQPLVEEYLAEVDSMKKYKVLFDRLVMNEMSIDSAQVIMLNLAQSLVLDYYAKQTEVLLSDTRKYTQILEFTGKFDLRGKKLMKYLGRTMGLKNKIAENLYILDSPKIVWEDQRLTQIDEDMSRELDISIRNRSIQENLNIVRENLETFKDVSQHRYSSMLEIVIILLILFEIINLVYEKLS